MDRLTDYSQIIESILNEHARIPYSHGNIESNVVVDAARNDFLLMIAGWDGHRRIHGCLVHVQIIDGKVWVQRDGIEDGITGELVAAGIPQDRIVLGFHPPDVRHHTEYAVA